MRLSTEEESEDARNSHEGRRARNRGRRPSRGARGRCAGADASSEAAAAKVRVGIIYSRTGLLAAYGAEYLSGLRYGLRYATGGTACRESYLLDYANDRARFMFNFGDGAVAGLLEADADRNLLLASHAITDGSFALQVKVPAGGSVEPPSLQSVEHRRHYLDVADPASMKNGLDEFSLRNFVAAARGAVERSDARLEDVSYVCGIHMKRSMHDAIVTELGVDPGRVSYLEDTGHMSGVDPLLGLDRAVRAGDVRNGDLVLLLAAGTGYTWAATTLRWGPA